jgi:hypothetical protein
MQIKRNAFKLFALRRMLHLKIVRFFGKLKQLLSMEKWKNVVYDTNKD